MGSTAVKPAKLSIGTFTSTTASLYSNRNTGDRNGYESVVLKKENWTSLLALLCVPKDLTTAKGRSGRLAVTSAPHRVDYRHRGLALQQPEHRICKERFREDGILLPFSQSRDDFTIPNPYVVQMDTNKTRWG
jgi:hypothetical protein